MFDIDCGRCGRRVLLTTSDIIDVTSHDGAIDVRYRCLCGATGTWRTGRGKDDRRSSVA